MTRQHHADDREVRTLLRDLPVTPVAEPEALWAGVRRGLAAPAPAAVPLHRRPIRSPLVTAAALLLAVLGGGAAGLARRYAPPGDWMVAPVAGAPSVAGRPLAADGRLATGQWLETDARSRAQLALGRIGTAQIGPGSRVRLDRSGLTEHRLTVERGTFSAVVSAPPRIFVVETPVVRATDLGCAYTLEVDGTGASRLRVVAGSVELRRGDAVTVVPMGLAAEVDVDGRPGTPYPYDVGTEVRAALHRVDTGTGRPGDVDTILGALHASDAHPTLRRRSAITLWHLLQRVDAQDRPRVYRRLAALYPEPTGVTMEGTVALDRLMLERWRADLYPTWSDEARTWVGRLGRRLVEWALR